MSVGQPALQYILKQKYKQKHKHCLNIQILPYLSCSMYQHCKFRIQGDLGRVGTWMGQSVSEGCAARKEQCQGQRLGLPVPALWTAIKTYLCRIPSPN